MPDKKTYVPHPDYPNEVWSDVAIWPEIEALLPGLATPADATAAVVGILNERGGDSIDREISFWRITQAKNWDYNDLYDAWLAQ